MTMNSLDKFVFDPTKKLLTIHKKNVSEFSTTIVIKSHVSGLVKNFIYIEMGYVSYPDPRYWIYHDQDFAVSGLKLHVYTD